MKVAGIVSEYNPFHNGHKYQIEKTLEDCNCDFIISVMSGDFTQRGDIAIFHKQERAKSALLNGVDLVLELPYFYSLSSAEFFSMGAIEILNSLGIVDYLSFGSECGCIDTLKSIASLLTNDLTQEKIKKNVKLGIPIFKAIEKALPQQYSSVLATPNNILGISYIKALNKLNSPIIPYTIKRKKADYHSTVIVDEFASATAIRRLIKNNEDFKNFVPKPAYEIYKNSQIFKEENLEKAIIYSLRSKNKSDFEKYADVSEGLHNLIYSSAQKFNSIEDIILNIKSKRYSYTRIRRIIYQIFLDINPDLRTSTPSFIKVLGFNEKGNILLNKIKETCQIPVVTNIKREMLLSHPSLKGQQKIHSIFRLGADGNPPISPKVILPSNL